MAAPWNLTKMRANENCGQGETRAEGKESQNSDHNRFNRHLKGDWYMSPFICVVQSPLFRTMYIIYQPTQFSLLLKQFRLFLHGLIKNGIGTKTHSTQLFINSCGTGRGRLHRSRLYHCPIKKLKLPVSQYTTQKYFIRGMVLGNERRFQENRSLLELFTKR